MNAEGEVETAEVAVNYGAFINTVITFILVAFCVFMVVKAYNNMKKKEEEAPAAPPAPSNQEVLLGEIRDLLKKSANLRLLQPLKGPPIVAGFSFALWPQILTGNVTHSG